MKYLLLAVLVMPTVGGSGCDGKTYSGRTHVITQPFEDRCWYMDYFACGARFYNCDSGKEYTCVLNATYEMVQE